MPPNNGHFIVGNFEGDYMTGASQFYPSGQHENEFGTIFTSL